MRLVIDGPRYMSAAATFTTANQVAAIQYDTLVGRLGSYAGMAGNDSTSTEFAAAYDEAAAEAVSALGDLVPSFANLGRLTERCAANHREANVRSIISGPAVYDGTWLPDKECVSVLAATPPSSLGGDLPGLPDKVNWILDHIEGFAWPNADTDRLRSAAAVWRGAAAGLDRLVDLAREAVDALWRQHSPEVAVAVAATEELASAVEDVALQFAGLAAACEEYADHVDQKREEILALVHEILAMIVEGVVISVAIGILTGGAGAVAASGAVIAKVAAQSPRFAAILSALRAAASFTSSSVRAAGTALKGARLRLRKFLDARIPPRNEFGQMSLHFGWGPGRLLRHERWGSHTLSRHAGWSDKRLLARLAENPKLKGASSFPDGATAERAIGEALEHHEHRIRQWLAGNKQSLPPLELKTDWIVGRHAARDGSVADAFGVCVHLIRDARMSEGFRILTAYPIR